MTAEAALLTRTWRVGDRYTVTLTVPAPSAGVVVCASCEWDPAMPRRLTPSELEQYRAGRDAALAQLATQLQEQ